MNLRNILLRAGQVSGLLFLSHLPLLSDTLFLNNGQVIQGTILKTDGKTITLQMVVGGGSAEIPYPLANIKKILFQDGAEIEKLLSSTDLEQLDAVQKLWEKRKPYLALSESNSGAVGLHYVRMLLDKKTKKAAQEALEIANQINQEDWLTSRKSDAQRLRLTALAASGKVEQAMAEAETMQQATGADEEGLSLARVQAQLTQATLTEIKLKELEKDWPKWNLMPEKRRLRTELLNKALDGYVYTAVFHPELKSKAAEGLWSALELYQRIGRLENALVLADEILVWFPETEYKSKAEQIKPQLEKLTNVEKN